MGTLQTSPRSASLSRRPSRFRRGTAADDRALVAHLLRRTSFGPLPGQVETLAGKGIASAIDAVLAAAPQSPTAPEFGTGDDRSVLEKWWLTAMARPEAGLHEKMVWFWHGHLTSSLDKAEAGLMWRQHQILREHALGNFRAMLQAITIDAAMLQWLDGAGSKADAPNENYAREVMELFALGRDAGYTEGDVKAGSEAFSGWWVDSNDGHKVKFAAENGPTRAVKLLGRSVSSAVEAINSICDHDHCAVHIAERLYRYFVGIPPDDTTLNRLASTFRAGGLEIKPLVEAILRDNSFMNNRMTRPRFPIEWYVASNAVLGFSGDPNTLELLGQQPFMPPNVAGWPVSNRWLSAGAAFTHAHTAWDHAGDTEVIDSDDPVTVVLEKAGLHEVSAETRTALAAAIATIDQRRDRATVLHALVVCCPEFALA